MLNSSLTPKQKQILEFITLFIEANRYSPSLDEIAKHFKKSISTIHQYVRYLSEKGYIDKTSYKVRSIEPISEDVYIPFYGYISAGHPIDIVPYPESLKIPRHLVKTVGMHYALKVRGDSMTGDGIRDGDVVVVKSQTSVRNGEKIVALINGSEVTLKKFYKTDGKIILKPANNTYKPIYIKPKDDFLVQGVVVGILRQKTLTIEKRTKVSLNNFINKVFERDCLDLLPQIPDNSIDLILCDLPYGTTQNSWDSEIPLHKLWKEYERIIKDNGVIALTSQGTFTAKLILSNLRLFKYKIIWVKSKPTNFLNAKKQPLRRHEDICIFYKNQPNYTPQMSIGAPYNKGVRKNQLTGSYGDFNQVEVKSTGERYPTDVVYFKTAESEGEVYHPTQKPIALARYLIRTFTKEGDVVLDNACGSGSFIVGAVLEKRRYIGIEKNQENYLHKNKVVDYIKVCEKRIRNALIQPPLFNP